MKSFEIGSEEKDIKDFLNKLFTEARFDSFYLYEARVKTNIDYYLNGKINTEYYEEGTKVPEYVSWKDYKNLILEYIKGERLPIFFKLILLFNKNNVSKLLEMNNITLSPEEINSLSLNIHLENNTLFMTTGTSLKIFTLDKTVEHIWDDTAEKYYSIL